MICSVCFVWTEILRYDLIFMGIMQSHWRKSTENSLWIDERTTENRGDDVCEREPLVGHRALIVCCSCVSLSQWFLAVCLRHVCICGWKMGVEVLWSLLKSLGNLRHTHTHTLIQAPLRKERGSKQLTYDSDLLPFGWCSQRSGPHTIPHKRSHSKSSYHSTTFPHDIINARFKM